VLVGHRHAQASLAEPPLYFRFDLSREIDFRESHVSMVVALDVLQPGELRAMRRCPWSPRWTSCNPASSAGSSLSMSPSANTTTPKWRPVARRLMIAPLTMSRIVGNGTFAGRAPPGAT